MARVRYTYPDMKYVQRVGTLYKWQEWNRIPIKEMEKKSRSSSHPSKMIIMIILREGHRRNEFLHNIFQQSKGAA